MSPHDNPVTELLRKYGAPTKNLSARDLISVIVAMAMANEEPGFTPKPMGKKDRADSIRLQLMHHMVAVSEQAHQDLQEQIDVIDRTLAAIAPCKYGPNEPEGGRPERLRFERDRLRIQLAQLPPHPTRRANADTVLKMLESAVAAAAKGAVSMISSEGLKFDESYKLGAQRAGIIFCEALGNSVPIGASTVVSHSIMKNYNRIVMEFGKSLDNVSDQSLSVKKTQAIIETWMADSNYRAELLYYIESKFIELIGRAIGIRNRSTDVDASPDLKGQYSRWRVARDAGTASKLPLGPLAWSIISARGLHHSRSNEFVGKLALGVDAEGELSVQLGASSRQRGPLASFRNDEGRGAAGWIDVDGAPVAE